jgi:hypothetical protein
MHEVEPPPVATRPPSPARHWRAVMDSRLWRGAGEEKISARRRVKTYDVKEPADPFEPARRS